MEEELKALPEEIQTLPAESADPTEETSASNTKYIIISVVVVLVVLALIVLATIYLANPANSQTTEQIRDVVIIFMALVGLVIGVALVILIVQLSTLINLLQNEIRPIIESTSETVNTLKGTAQFVSSNLTEPVIKMNQLMAMIKQLFSLRKR